MNIIYSIVVVVCLGALALVSGFVLGYRRAGAVRRSFLVLSTFVLTSLVLQWLALMPVFSPQAAEILFRLQVGCWLSSGMVFLWFAAALLSRPIDAGIIGLSVVASINALVGAATDLVMQSFTLIPGGLAAVTNRPLEILLTAIAILPAAVGVHWLEQQRRSSRVPERRGLLISAELSAGITAIVITVVDILLPWSGVLTDMPRVSAVALSIGILTAYSAVRRHTLMEVSLESAALPLFERLGDGILLVDLSSRIRWANASAAALFAKSPSELLGKQLDELLGTPIPTHAFSGRLVTIETSQRKHHLSVTQWTNDVMGVPVGRVLLIADVTERIAAQALMRRTHDELEREVERRTAELLAAQRLDAARALSRGVAHVLNNLLAVVLGLAESIRDMIGHLPAIGQDMQELLRATERSKDIVRQIEPVTPDGSNRQSVVLRHLVKQVWKDATLGLSPSIQARIDLEIEGQVAGNPTQIHQALYNLVKNARESMTDRSGSLRVRLTEMRLAPSADMPSADLVPGRYARIDVEDEGCGIPTGALETIFEPLYTTKTPDKGTGLGLFNARRIAKEHGGSLTVTSEEGKGSRFSLFLPLLDQDIQGGPLPNLAFVGGSENILIIDDEPRVADATARLLRPLGYQVSIELDGNRALQRLNSSENFDAVICDQIMPIINGTELVAALRKIGHSIPVILLSGTTDTALVQAAEHLHIHAVLRKPVSRVSLARVLREELDR